MRLNLKVVVLALLVHLQHGRAGVFPDDVLVGIDQETRRAAGGVADAVVDVGIDEFDDHPDDVARRPELPVLPGGGELREEVFEDVALRVAVLCRDVHLVDDGDGLLKEGGLGDDEDGVLHLSRKEGLLAVVQVLDEGEDFVPHMGEHLIGRIVLPVRPPALLMPVEDRGVRYAPHPRPLLLDDVHVLQPLHEDEVGHLFDGLERVGDPTAPEVIP